MTEEQTLILIFGDLAVKEGLTCVSDSPGSVSVVGGSTIKLKFGQYAFNLGPTHENKYAEIDVIGIGKVTEALGVYDLADIQEEFRKTGSKCER